MTARIRPLIASLVRHFFGGVGCVFVLHRIIPSADRSPIADNRSLELTTHELRYLLAWTRKHKLEVIPLDEVPQRLASPTGKKFICFSSDDGYRDNMEHAAPLFREFDAPWTLFVSPGLVEGSASVWWYAMERVLQEKSELTFEWQGQKLELAISSEAQRNAAHESLAKWVCAQGAEQRDALVELICAPTGVSPKSMNAELILSWDELRTLSKDPLVTIGAHSLNHHALSKLSPTALRDDLTRCKAVLESELGRPIRHLAYPFGRGATTGRREAKMAAECGYTTAYTTIAGNLFPEHAGMLHELPRLGPSGNYRLRDRLALLESGFFAARENHWKRVVPLNGAKG